MGLRKGDYIGFWSPENLKKVLQESARKQHRTLSQEVIHRLEDSVKAEERKAAEGEKEEG